MTNTLLKLNGFTFQELFHAKGLKRLDDLFLEKLQKNNSHLAHNLINYREKTQNFTSIELSELLLAVAPILEEFIINLFNIENEVGRAQSLTLGQNPVANFKKHFVLRRAKKNLLKTENLSPFSSLNTWLHQEISQSEFHSSDLELAVSLMGLRFLTDVEKYSSDIEKLTQWCIHALITPEACQIVKNWTSFRLPKRTDFQNLVETTTIGSNPALFASPDKNLRHRDGFKLTDPRMDAREVQDEVNYCIYCHDHDGDFCSKGFPVKKGEPTLGLKKNPLGITLTGCPLEEKISETNLLKRDGHTLAALAMVMVDNPMCPATGHRICNDCMKACIYQKQDPVNIPQIETRVLTDVLNLPWGVEIYDLLTRWNPLRQSQWVMKPYNGLKVMIAGMGPAGFTLAHHLLLEGFAVVGFDGLKIEPLPEHVIKNPIYHFDQLKESLDSRLMAGFGGVAEYGITVRWDKNFLKLIYISLMRRPYFQVFGSIRFGGTITIPDAWEMGFDHFVIAVGAGLPKALPIPGSMAPGMRQANDFLMALQLGNAAKKESLTNLQVRLPAIIIGGGLTGVDTATEVQAYYITQVEKTMARFEILVSEHGEQYILDQLDEPSKRILEEYLAHGLLIKNERQRAAENNTPPDFLKLIRAWGGVTIVYRRTMQESPAYTNNHEELQKALEEGVYYLEALEPTTVLLDSFGHVEQLTCQRRFKNQNNLWETKEEFITLPARSIFVATGTQPNIAYEFEHRGTFIRQGLQYQHYEDINGELNIPHGITHNKEKNFGPFTSYHKEHYRVSLIGDTHPVFHGSVVKAIASGMRTYPKILEVLHSKLQQQGSQSEYQQFASRIRDLFSATITKVERRTHNVVELTVKAPLAAKHFQPGQFYRLQNFETFAPRINNTSLQIEPLALIAANVDHQHDLLKFMIIEAGASSKICATFKPNDPVALMGPTGVRAKIAHQHETVLIIGNQLSIAFVLSYGTALRAAGNRVIYLASVRDKSEIYCQEELENTTDLIMWCTKTQHQVITNRPQDYSCQGNPIDALIRYAQGNLHPNKNTPEINLEDIDRIYLLQKSQEMREFQNARKTVLKEWLVKDPLIYGSVYSTMQCMLKGVCAQCLQWQIDPETGARTKAVFACSWQDQPLELIDFANLEERLMQNRLQETLSNLWVDHLFDKFQINKV